MGKKVKIFKLLKWLILVPVVGLGYWGMVNWQNWQKAKIRELELGQEIQVIGAEKSNLEAQRQELQNKYEELLNSDQVTINKKLTGELGEIKKTYIAAMAAFEDLVDIKDKSSRQPVLDKEFAKILSQLSTANYSSASASLTTFKNNLKKKQEELAALIKIPENVKQSDTPPAAGYARQVVKMESGDVLVDIISADLKDTKVVVETESSGTCVNDCPVNALAEYVKRAGGFAGINGPYFCPATYPSCAGKTNSFDTLLMNKNKVYFNSDNNVYSSVPAAIFSGSARFVAHSSEWGRDTGVDSVIAGQPMLVFNGTASFSSGGDEKQSGKGSRAFIGATDNTVYIGVVHGVSVAQMSQVLAKMGIKNAINLDSGGSTALYAGGKYVVGPGRNTPFGIVLVRR